MRLAALGLSYSKVGKLLGFAKSTLCKWLRQESLPKDGLAGEVLEADGLWARTTCGKVELKVVRDDLGKIVLSFESWEKTMDQVSQRGSRKPLHVVTDGDLAIAEAMAMVLGHRTPHQLCQFHLLREYRRNIGIKGWDQAKALVGSKTMDEAQTWAGRLSELTGGQAAYWCHKVLENGLTSLSTGQDRWKTTSRLERFQRELRRRERMGTRWSPHDLTLLLHRGQTATSTT